MSKQPGKQSTANDGERIAKRLARAGLCSRREAERWIADGRVKVDGKRLTSPAFNVTEKSRILVDGKVLPRAEAAKLWRHYKPKGRVTSHRDPEGRPTVFEHLPADLPRVISIGRLDLTTEGLLLLSNDGDLARYLELPSTGWRRRYRVRVHGRVTAAALAGLKDGITVDGVRYGPIEATLDHTGGSNSWLGLTLTEGKNREVRNVLGALGLEVNRLIRTAYGPFQLGDLPEGETKQVTTRVLRDQLGAKAVDFGLEAPQQKPQQKERTRAHRRRKPSR